jgi:molybdopterin molybdotransferase/putative molybdopterin biosynthesis protein
MARKRYLKKTPLKEAKEFFLAKVEPSRIGNEFISVEEALDRITAVPVFAKISSPHYHAAAMDGICVRAEDTFGATEFKPKTLICASSDSPGPNAFHYVDTGKGECGDHDRKGSPAQRWIVRDF